MIYSIIDKFKKSIYLLIPMCCILLWAFITLAKDNFSLTSDGGAADFDVFYYVSKNIFIHPEDIYVKLYGEDPYTYTPFFAIIYWPMGLFTFEQAHWIYFISLVILAELIIIVFNQILIFKKITNKVHRFLFLLAIGNGLVYMNNFDSLTGCILPSFILILFIKREIKYRVLNRETKETKFILVQMMLLVLVIGIFIQFFFFVIIYLFHDINKMKDIFNEYQLKRYLFLVISFIIQNFMIFIIYFMNSNAFDSLLGGYWRGERSLPPKSYFEYSNILRFRYDFACDGITSIYYTSSLYVDYSGLNINLFLISLTIMIIITIMISSMKSITIEKKFGWWTLSALFFYTLVFVRYFVGLLPLITILLADYYIGESKNTIDFIKKNFILLVGLFCIACLYFMPPIHLLIRVFPFLWNIPIALLLLRWLIIYIILLVDLVILSKKYKFIFLKHKELNS